MAGSAPLSAGKVVTESLRCRKALISDVSHQCMDPATTHLRPLSSERSVEVNAMDHWLAGSHSDKHTSALFCARQERPFAGCWRNSRRGIVGCVAADGSTPAGKNVVQLFNRNLSGPVVCVSNVFVECTHVLGCSVRLWWIFALTRCADNSGLGPINLHAPHIIVRPTMWSFLMVSMSVDNQCPRHNPPFQFLSCGKGSGHQPVRIFWTWHGL